MPTVQARQRTPSSKLTKPKAGVRGWMNERVYVSTKLELRQLPTLDAPNDLPEGVCGRLTGIALTYNVSDEYGTVFLPGSLARTRAEAVARAKVKLFADHGPFTETHVGVVRSLDDVGDAAVMTADLFDTEAGREMKEYLAAVLASGGETGLSIGFRPIEQEWRADPESGDMFCAFKEIALREISITPVPAVPGTTVTSVRQEPGETEDALLVRVLRTILAALPEREARAVFDAVYPIDEASAGADPSDTSVAPVADATATAAGAETDAARGTESATDASGDGSLGARLATMEHRLKAVRFGVAMPVG